MDSYAIPESRTDNGPTTSVSVTAGHSYHWWVHTRTSDPVVYSPQVDGNFTCDLDKIPGPIITDPVPAPTPDPTTAPVPSFSTTSLAAGMVGSSYSASIDIAYVGLAPFNATVTGLPAGVTITNAMLGILPLNGKATLTLSGTPTVAGTFTVNVSLLVSGTNTPVTKTLTLLIISNPTSPGTLSITTPSLLANAKVGQNYFTLLTGSGGALPYGWSGSNLPPGLSVSNQQVDNNSNLGGVPTVAGTYSFSVTVTAGSVSASKQFSLTVDPAPTATGPSVSVSPSLVAVGSAVTVSWANISNPKATNWIGLYPLGVNDLGYLGHFYLGTCAGTIGSAPPVTGSCSFTIPSVSGGAYKFTLFEDAPPANGLASSANFTIGSTTTTAPTALAINDISLTAAKLGTPYSQVIGTSGAVPGQSAQWSLVAGAYPPGISFSSCGSGTCGDLVGTPTTAGTYVFTLQVIQGSASATREFILNVDGIATAALNILTTSPLRNAQVGQTYSASIESSGGAGPYAWNISSGSLPAGLDLQITDGKGCQFATGTTACELITGTPTATGTYSFLLRLSSKADEITKAFTITVDPATVEPTTPKINTGPIGWIDTVTADGHIVGWALDPDHLDLPIDVHVYFDGGARVGAVPTPGFSDILRDDVNKSLGATGNHGFSVLIPTQYRDGKIHTIYVYGIDRNDLTGNSNNLISGYGRPFQLGAVSEPGIPVNETTSAVRHPRGTVVIDNGTVYFLGTALRYPFSSSAVFLAWGHKFMDIAQANAADMALPLGPVPDFPQ